MRKPTPKSQPRWGIIAIGKGRYISTVTAADADKAIEVAMREFEITDRERHFKALQ